MYAISNWARHHVKAARLLLTLLHIYLFAAAWWIARQASLFSPLRLSLMAIIAFGLVWVTAFVKRKIENRQHRFRLQKARFFVTGAGCLLLLIAFFSSSTSFRYQLYGNLNGAFTENTNKKERPAWNDYTNKKQYSEDLKAYYSTLSKKELRKEIRHQLKSFREMDSASKTGLIVLVVFFSLIALFLVAGLACNISCSGNDALALVVLIAGSGGLIALAYFLIRKIRKTKPAPVKQEDSVSQSVPGTDSNVNTGTMK